MSLYQPSAQVEPTFKNYLQELYAETEDPASTTSFTDFFTPNGSLIVLQYTAVGAERITGLKHALMPKDGSKLWHHVPNVTDVYADTTWNKIYEVKGVIQTTYQGGNCSQAYYSTRFTVAKDNDNKPILALRAGSLLSYDDYIVEPSVSPTEIPCQGAMSSLTFHAGQL
ncbi:hypothetical protein M406DRAFT_335362 [Cryphonectria parasitica EP155]|uniref:Uncharacterized protein n=1 Tax=Cryphonectria parasitica (strain ATCC 38755 / EP155) TaxID=660469 RepID=A0A9P5CSC6_CRYP1|nr:uncharacterized protein M406DRAFT_335362 [Cryphonectria parasitica EP155]KAF3769474.1 hypothetical protein M406DRAFT_335362 [Cryphonectria parasitica EP155]